VRGGTLEPEAGVETRVAENDNEGTPTFAEKRQPILH
jgi:hypothetical protein